MDSFRAYVKKEYIEGVRTHKFLVILIGMLFFAIADPVMLKFLPMMLSGQLGDVDISKLFPANQQYAMMNYTKDLFQISMLVMVLSLMTIISGEKNSKTLTIPVSMGCSPFGIVIGKMFLYGIFVTVSSIIGMAIAYYYSGIVFKADFAGILQMIKAGVLYGLFYTFVLSILVFLGTLFEKPYLAGMFTLIAVYLISFAETLFKWGKYLPSALLTEAKQFDLFVSQEFCISLILTIIIMISLIFLASAKLRRTELV